MRMNVVMVVQLALAGSAWARDAIEAPWGEAEPGALRAAAEAASDPEGTGVALLADEDHVHVSAGGLRDWGTRLVYHLRTPEAVDAWGHVRVCWHPWYQARPEVRVRVIAPDGRVHVTTGDDLQVSTRARDGDTAVYGDRSCLEGPIANVTKGAVVEEVSHVRDTRAFFGGFASGSDGLAWSDRTVGRRHVRITADPGVDVHLVSQGGAVDVRRRRTRQGLRLEVLEEDLAPIPGWEMALPLDRQAGRALLFHTAPSWAAVADAYRAALAEKVDAAGLEDLVAEVAAAPDLAEATRRALRGVQARLRYTGLELGERALIPYAPGECVDRGFGDCKDQATAFVAVMRAAGHDADVALLNADVYGQDDPGWIAMRRFNHAIAVVHGPDGDVWVDPTDPHAAVGELPRPDQGRYALVIREGTDALVETPRQVARRTATVRVDARRSGKAPMVVEVETTGSFARDMKAWAASAAGAERVAWAEGYAEEVYGGVLSELALSGLDGDDPVTARTLRLSASDMGLLAGTGGTLDWGFGLAWSEVPLLERALVEEARLAVAAGAAPAGIRMVPFSLERTHVWTLPPGWEPVFLPEGYDVAVGGLDLHAGFAFDAPELRMTVRHSSDGATLSLDQELELLDAIERLGPRLDGWQLEVEPAALARIRADPVGAFDALRDVLEAHPDDPQGWSAWARALGALGFPHEEEAVLDREARRFPEAMGLWKTRLSALLEASVVESVPEDVLFPEAVEAADRILELFEGEHYTTQILVRLLRFGVRGVELGPPARLERALDLLPSPGGTEASAEDVLQRLGVLAELGRWEEIAAEGYEAMPSAETQGIWLAAQHALGRGDYDVLLRRIPDEDLGPAVDGAAAILWRTRRFADVAALFDAAAPRVDDPAALRRRADIARRTRPWEAVAAGGDPLGASVRFFAWRFGLDEGDAQDLVVDLSAFDLDTDPREGLTVASQVVVDLTTAGEVVPLGDRHARVDLTSQRSRGHVWLERRRKDWRVLALSEARGPLSRRVLDALDAGDDAGARRWHEQLRLAIDAHGSSLDAGAAGLFDPDTPVAVVRLVALAEQLAVAPERAVAAAAAALEAVPVDARLPALAWGLMVSEAVGVTDAHRGWYALVVDHGDALPDRVRQGLRVQAAEGAEDLRALLAEGPLAVPAAADAWGRLAETHPEEALVAFEDLHRRHPDEPGLANLYAWWLLVRGEPGDAARAVEVLERSFMGRETAGSAEQHTYATALLAVGRTADALATFQAHGKTAPGSTWDLVRGGLAEACGLRDLAVRTYAAVDAAPGTGTRRLVDRALARLGE